MRRNKKTKRRDKRKRRRDKRKRRRKRRRRKETKRKSWGRVGGEKAQSREDSRPLPQQVRMDRAFQNFHPPYIKPKLLARYREFYSSKKVVSRAIRGRTTWYYRRMAKIHQRLAPL